MQNNIRFDLCQELRQLLEDWHSLEVNKSATERDFARLSQKIHNVTNLLEELDNKQVSK